MKTHKFIFISILLFIYGCQFCPPDVVVERFELSSEAIDFFPYRIYDTIHLEHENGYELSVNTGNGLIRSTDQNNVTPICTIEEDVQFEAYSYQVQTVRLQDEFENPVVELELRTLHEPNDDPDSIVYFDYFTMNGSNYQFIIKERRGVVSEAFKEEFNNPTTFIGDTLINGISYSNVYHGIDNEGGDLFFNKEQGIISFRASDDGYWFLKE